MDKYEQAENRLAELMEVPKWGMWPQWCRSDAAAFSLMVEHGCYPTEDHEYDGIEVFFNQNSFVLAKFADHPDKKTAVRYAIVQSVIAKLEVSHPKEGA
jgi:hypothetical protein